jgi:hypothetical protein
VRGARGRVLVLVLYDPERDDGLMVGGLRRWATSLGRSQVELFALTVGGRHDAQAFFRYYAAEWGVPRLAPFWLEPWKPGALDSTMATLGVRVGATWSVPLVAVIDPDGRVIAQWQGETVAQPIIAAAEHALDRRSAPRTASASAPAPSASPPPGSAAPLSSPANR